MWGLIFTVGAVIVLALFPAVRCAVLHPLHVLWYGALDTFGYIRRKQYNLCHTGDLDIYNTLAVVNTLQKRYDEKDMMTEAEILAARAPAAPTPDAVTNRSRKGRKIQRK